MGPTAAGAFLTAVCGRLRAGLGYGSAGTAVTTFLATGGGTFRHSTYPPPDAKSGAWELVTLKRVSDPNRHWSLLATILTEVRPGRDPPAARLWATADAVIRLWSIAERCRNQRNGNG